MVNRWSHSFDWPRPIRTLIKRPSTHAASGIPPGRRLLIGSAFGPAVQPDAGRLGCRTCHAAPADGGQWAGRFTAGGR